MHAGPLCPTGRSDHFVLPRQPRNDIVCDGFTAKPVIYYCGAADRIVGGGVGVWRELRRRCFSFPSPVCFGLLITLVSASSAETCSMARCFSICWRWVLIIGPQAGTVWDQESQVCAAGAGQVRSFVPPPAPNQQAVFCDIIGYLHLALHMSSYSNGEMGWMSSRADLAVTSRDDTVLWAIVTLAFNSCARLSEVVGSGVDKKKVLRRRHVMAQSSPGQEFEGLDWTGALRVLLELMPSGAWDYPF
ncbi:hypothetical protein BC829DRAFT_445260 [Chytridium lagenaria]|nr:hypothetical protein BC829DRAFT_445260 [Chytridium lagenaria]